MYVVSIFLALLCALSVIMFLIEMSFSIFISRVTDLKSFLKIEIKSLKNFTGQLSIILFLVLILFL